MPPRTRLLLLTLLALLATASLPAAGPYLNQEAPDPVRLLPAPPAPGSAEDLADRDEAFRVYAARTPAEFARGVAEQNLTIFQLTAGVIPAFQPGRCPQTEELFRDVERETTQISRAAKKLWNRQRPYAADPARFNPVVEREAKPSPSYPSGHATRATLYAILLGELFPAHRDALLRHGRESGWLRVQGGVHTPLDIYAGRTLGQALAQAFLNNPAFQRDLAEAKAEIARTLPEPAAVSR